MFYLWVFFKWGEKRWMELMSDDKAGEMKLTWNPTSQWLGIACITSLGRKEFKIWHRVSIRVAAHSCPCRWQHSSWAAPSQESLLSSESNYMGFSVTARRGYEEVRYLGRRRALPIYTRSRGIDCHTQCWKAIEWIMFLKNIHWKTYIPVGLNYVM